MELLTRVRLRVCRAVWPLVWPIVLLGLACDDPVREGIYVCDPSATPPGPCPEGWFCRAVAGGGLCYRTPGATEDAARPQDAGLDAPMDAADTPDAGSPDAELADVDAPDMSPLDVGLLDMGPIDADSMDADPVDADPFDVGPMDADSVDMGPSDAGPMDVGPLDSGSADAGPADSGPIDAGPPGVVVDLALGRGHTCALRDDGAVFCWGDTSMGQVDGTVGTMPAGPTRVLGLPAMTTISAGSEHTCAVATDGAVWCWGSNASGQSDPLERMDTVVAPSSVGLLPASVEVAAGDAHTCARTLATPRVLCWGSSAFSALGPAVGPGMTHAGPAVVMDAVMPTRIRAGARHTCAIVGSSAQIACWGDNASGQLGSESAGSSSGAPVLVGEPSAVVIGAEDIDLGPAHGCAIAGGLRCWGSNLTGQVARAPATTAYPVPQMIAGTPPLLRLAAGGGLPSDGHTCGLRSTGITCWGDNSSEQTRSTRTSDNWYVPSDSAITIVGPTAGSPRSTLAAGALHTCAIRGPAGTAIECWGNNADQQLGSPSGAALIELR